MMDQLTAKVAWYQQQKSGEAKTFTPIGCIMSDKIKVWWVPYDCLTTASALFDV